MRAVHAKNCVIALAAGSPRRLAEWDELDEHFGGARKRCCAEGLEAVTGRVLPPPYAVVKQHRETRQGPTALPLNILRLPAGMTPRSAFLAALLLAGVLGEWAQCGVGRQPTLAATGSWCQLAAAA